MSNGYLALTIISSVVAVVVAYCFVVGAVYGASLVRAGKTRVYERSDLMFVAAFWPITSPVILGRRFIERRVARVKVPRATVRKEK